jgi:hypothetical protein
MTSPAGKSGLSPYKGLMPFAPEDAAFFFGRESEIEIVTANLLSYPLTLLYGLSGVGKSSILSAGVARRLRQEARRKLFATGSPEFAVVLFRNWRKNPREDLVPAICSEAAEASGTAPLQPDRRMTLGDVIENCAKQVGGEIFLILDQFEDYFQYNPDDSGDGSFAAEFARALTRPGLPAGIILSIREDSLAKLDRFKGRIPKLFENYIRIEHLGYEAARAAIIRPLRQFGRITREHVALDGGLAERILDEVRAGQISLEDPRPDDLQQQAGQAEVDREHIEAPYLQLILTRLWHEERRRASRKLRLSTFNSLGGAREIARSHLDQALLALSPEERDAAARAFRFLVTRSRTKVAYTAADLADHVALPAPVVTSLLEKLSSGPSRILCPIAPQWGRGAEVRYELYHDVLAEGVIRWRTQQEEQRRRRKQEREMEAARAAAEEARNRAQKEAAAARRFRRLSAAVWIMSIAVVGLGWLAWRTHQQQIASQALAAEQKAYAKLQEELVAKLQVTHTAELEAAKSQTPTPPDPVPRVDLPSPVKRPPSGQPGRPEPTAVEPSMTTVVWSGSLEPETELTIEGDRASTGRVTRALPRGPMHLISVTPSSVQVVERPTAANGWQRVRLRSGTRTLGAIILTFGPGNE